MCTCIYIYVCAYIYVYVSWLHAWMDGWMNGCMYFCKCVSIHVCMYLRMYKPKHSAAFPPSASERLSHKRILVCQYTWLMVVLANWPNAGSTVKNPELASPNFIHITRQRKRSFSRCSSKCQA